MDPNTTPIIKTWRKGIFQRLGFILVSHIIFLWQNVPWKMSKYFEQKIDFEIINNKLTNVKSSVNYHLSPSKQMLALLLLETMVL